MPACPPSSTRDIRRLLLLAALAASVALASACGGASGDASSSPSPAPSPSPSPSSLTVTSEAGADGGTLPAAYTCDGPGGSPQLSWSGAPAGTQQFVVMMTTIPGPGSLKWNWIVHSIPAATSSLARDTLGVGVLGVGSDGPRPGYQPPCSQGPDLKLYTFTVYALSAAPSWSADGPVDGATLTAAIAPLTLASGSITLGYDRTSGRAGSAPACGTVRDSLLADPALGATASCDDTYAYVGSAGIASHDMMAGITASNLQVPIPQNFQGANAWRIPLAPAIASTPTAVTDGPVGVAINGVPIFNPCKQGGCQYGDTKALGELDACNGHAGRADDYHYHAAPVCLMATHEATYWDTHPIGWALDGFAILGYHDADGTTAARDDVCGGNTNGNPGLPPGYAYHVTDASPYVLSCLRGTPSPDLAGQGAKYTPLRVPPVVPFTVSGMSLGTDSSDGARVLSFTSATSFTTTETGTDSHPNGPGAYRIRYLPLTGDALAAALAQSANAGKVSCWTFQFQTDAGTSTQPDAVYCR